MQSPPMRILLILLSLTALTTGARAASPDSAPYVFHVSPFPTSAVVTPTSTTVSWFDTALTPGPFTTSLLPQLRLKSDLGIRIAPLDPPILESLGLWFDWGKGVAAPGGMALLVSEVVAGSPAELAGVIPGDILTALEFGQGGAQVIATTDDFDLAMEQISPGDVTRMVFFRRGATVTVDVVAAPWDSILQPAPEDGRSRYVAEWKAVQTPLYRGERLECLREWRAKSDPMALKDRADMALIWKDYTAAAEEYKQVLHETKNATNPYPALFGQAHALRMCGELPSARETIEKTIETNPLSIRARIEHIQITLQQQDIASAIQMLADLQTILPPLPNAFEEELFQLF